MGSATGDAATPLTTDLTGLSPNTTYFWRVEATNSLGTTTGTTESFTTLGSVPTVASEQSSGLSGSGATVSASVSAGLLSTSVSVVYGTNATLSTGTSTQSMGSATGDAATPLTTDLTGLSPQTKYYYKVVATNAVGTTTGTIKSFTTLQDSATAAIHITVTLGGSRANGPVLTSADVFLDARSSSAASGTVTKFEWDLDGDGTYEIDGGLTGTYTTRFTKHGTMTVEVRVTGRGGLDDTETTTVDVRKSPPVGEPGVSVFEGSAFTNTKAIKLNLVWPAFATEARVSNDGGFSNSKTKIFEVNNSIDWELDDSVTGIFTKVVYVRFSGSGIDTTKTYSDDIILDSTPPSVSTASGTSAVVPSSSVTAQSLASAQKKNGAVLRVKASDRLSGIGSFEVKTSSKGKVVSVRASSPMAKSHTVKVKTKARKIWLRSVDRAGNKSRWVIAIVK